MKIPNTCAGVEIADPLYEYRPMSRTPEVFDSLGGKEFNTSIRKMRYSRLIPTCPLRAYLLCKPYKEDKLNTTGASFEICATVID